MHGPILSVLLAIAGLLGGTFRPAGEDYQMLRGGDGAAKTHTNAFQAEWNDDYGPQPGAGLGIEPGFSARRAVQPDNNGYLKWKNNCVAQPPVVGGEAVDLEKPRGFERVAPYVKKPESDGSGYIDLLADELNGE